MGLTTLVPWQAKIALKLFLARIPADYALWRRLHIFRHGDMRDPSYALEVFCKYYRWAQQRRSLDEFTCLELGPGDSLFSAVIAKAYGARHVWLVDVGRFANPDVAPYRALAEQLRAEGLPAADLSTSKSLADVLAACDTHYCTAGLEGLADVPSESLDFQWSHAVLEHVRLCEFAETLAHLYRTLKPGGISCHCIDLRDHLGGRLNNLRFSHHWWENDSIANSGFYTNRIRYGEMLALFRAAGFEVEVLEEQRWPQLPTPRKHLAPNFRACDDSDLNVAGFRVVLTRR